MKLIDFDKHFSAYTAQWVKEHEKDYKNFDAMEQDMPNVYLRFLNTPAKWLDGVTPGAYFSQFDDCKELVDWLILYCVKRVPVPAQLLDRIVEVGIPCEKRLIALLKDQEMPMDAKMTAVGLLREMESTAPRAMYIAWQQNRKEKDELADNALESLQQMGQLVVGQLTEVIGNATAAGQEAMLDVLSNFPGNEKVFQIALKLFETQTQKRAVLAGYLGKLGDARAIDALIAAAKDEKLKYLDYIEIRNAIEMLGGEAPEREFESDATFEAMQRMQ